MYFLNFTDRQITIANTHFVLLRKAVTFLSEKNNNRSLYLYTALIFIVAILMIVISFFSQINLNKTHEEYIGTDADGISITEKAAQLSTENLMLTEKTIALTNSNAQLEEQAELLNAQIFNVNLMLKVFANINTQNFETAHTDFLMIDTAILNEEQTIFYNYLKEQLQN